MAVYYKFKSAKDYDSIPMDGPFLSVGTLKEKIFESKHLGRGTDFDLVVTNAQTNEEYLDEAMLIPKNTSVLIRRVPGRPRMTIVTEQEPKVESKMDDPEPEKSSFPVSNASTMKYPEDSEWDEFGNDLYAIPEVLPVQSNNPVPEALPTNKADEDSKIKALIDTPALDWQRQGPDGFAHGRGFGRGGMGGRMGGRGFGFERKTPPQGYVCHRCKVPGHFIQPCPDGSYALPSGAVAVLRPNEAAFEREIEGLPSTRSVGELPPELHCPLCKDVMKDAVLTLYCAVFRASVIDFFTTKPYAFEPSSLPKYPPSKEMDAKLRDEEARRLRATSKANPDGVRRSRQRDRAMRGIPAPEANAELQANLDLADLTGELMWLAIGRISEGELEFAEKICRFVRDIYRELTLLVPHMDDSYDMKTKMDTMLQSVMKIENGFPV